MALNVVDLYRYGTIGKINGMPMKGDRVREFNPSGEPPLYYRVTHVLPGRGMIYVIPTFSSIPDPGGKLWDLEVD